MLYETRTVKIVVCPANKPLYDIECTYIEIIDEAGGEFIAISQERDDSYKDVRITPEEWNVIQKAVNDMIKQCRTY